MKKIVIAIVLCLSFVGFAQAYDSAHSGAVIDAEITRSTGRNTAVGDPGSDAELVTEQAVREAIDLYLLLAGGTLTGELVVDNLGVEITDGDDHSDCTAFASGYGFFADTSENKLKKCENGSLSDWDTDTTTDNRLTESETQQAFGAADATPDVTNGGSSAVRYWATGGVVTITDLDDGSAHTEFSDGDWIMVICDHAITLDLSSNANMIGHNGEDWTATAGDDWFIAVWDNSGSTWQIMVSSIKKLPSIAITDSGASDGDIAVYDNTGDDRMEFVADVKTEFIPIGYMQVDGTTDPDALTTEDNMQYRNFDSGSDEDVEFLWSVPTDISGSTIKVRAIAVVTNATTPGSGEGVSWGIAAASSGTNDTHDPTLGTEVYSEDADLSGDAGAQWDIVFFPYVEVTPTGLAGGELCAIRIDRATGDADDDYLQDIGLVGVEIKFKRNRASLTW